MFTEPSKTLPELNLEHYEILSNELLHDISYHTKNLYSEIPHHFKDKKKIENIINTSFKNKAAKNSSDYRESLVTITKLFLDTYPNQYITQILLTMSEIQKILYQPDNLRTWQLATISYII